LAYRRGGRGACRKRGDMQRRIARERVPLPGTAIDCEGRERLTDRHHRYRIDVHVCRASDDPMYCVRNVLGGERLRARVNGDGPFLVPFEANNGKLGFREARFNVRDAQRGSQEVGSQVMRKLFNEGFRGERSPLQNLMTFQ
jgi:hypothetical protein